MASSSSKTKPKAKPVPVLSRQQMMTRKQLRRFMGSVPVQVAMASPKGRW